MSPGPGFFVIAPPRLPGHGAYPSIGVPRRLNFCAYHGIAKAQRPLADRGYAGSRIRTSGNAPSETVRKVWDVLAE